MDKLQEKFQTILRPDPSEDERGPWKPLSSARKTFEPGTAHKNNTTADEPLFMKMNEMPPNMEVPVQRDNSFNGHPDQTVRQLAGCTDVSYDTNPESMEEGYTRHAMNGSDDLYNGEHMDHFYGEVEDEEGKKGFAERNNYLDRA